MFRLRAVEWLVLCFIAFVVVWAGPGALSTWPAFTDRAGAVTVAVLVVALVHELVRWRRSRRVLPRATWLSLLPLAFALGLTASDGAFWSALAQAPTAADALLLAGKRVLVVLALAVPVPLAVLWAAQFAEGTPRLGLGLKTFAGAVREWAPLVFLLSGYAWMRAVAPVPERTYDAELAAADVWLFGVDPLDWLSRFIHPALSELLAFVYASYALLFPVCLGVVAFVGGPKALREASFGLGLALVTAYVSYALVPVRGPVLERGFDTSLELYLVRDVKEALMDRLRHTYDCFPSMHTAATVLLVALTFRASKRVGWWLLPIVTLMPLACVYLRYHYVVDVLAGEALAFAVLAVLAVRARWLERAEPQP